MFRLSLAFLAYFATTQATTYLPLTFYTNAESDVFACDILVNKIAFCPKTEYTCLCTSDLARATLAGCLWDNGRYTQDAMDVNIKTCSSYYQINVTYAQWASSLALYKSDAVPSTEMANYNSTEGLITRPIRFTKESTSVILKAYHRFLINFNVSNYYGFALLGYWVLVLIGFGISNWLKYLFPLVFVRTNDWFKGLKAHVVSPALYRRKQQALHYGGKIPGSQFFQILVPSRIESVVLFGFFLLCFVFLSVDMAFVPGDPVKHTKSAALETYLGDRSGIIATVNIPLLILFGGRNNFMQWLTGINFATMITYHKWMSRVFIIMVIIHSICYSLLYTEDYAEDMKEEYLIWGLLGTAAGGLIYAQSFLYLRRKSYEIFLVVHIFLVAAFIMGTWKHVQDLGYVGFTYVAIALWLVDRIVRIGRMVVFGFPKVDVQLISGIIKIQVPIRRFWKPTPGGFAYVYFILMSKFFQSHPYSYLTLPNQINFYIRVKTGITQKLQQELISLPGMTKNMRVSVEGPYGGGLESCNIKHYHRAIYIAGGNAIPGMYGEALHSKNSKFIWVIRDYSTLNWFWEELKMLKDMDFDVYVTRADEDFEAKSILERESEADKISDAIQAGDFVSESEEKEDKEEKTGLEYNKSVLIDNIKKTFPHINFIHAKPTMQHLVATELLVPGLSVAFVACGHPEMVDEIRAEVSKGHKEKRVDFYEHLQVWA